MNMEAIINERFVAPTQAARTLGRSRARIQQLIQSGKLRTIATPLGRLVYVSSLRKLFNEMTSAKGE